jgi:outer membrane immunogenic protein
MRSKTIGASVCLAALMAVAANGAAHAQTRYDWTGVYVGANMGASANSVDWTYFNNPAQSVSREFTAFSYGMQAGAQMQMGQVVLGAEFGLSGSKSGGTGPDSPLFAPLFDTHAQVQQVLTIGPRLGWAFNNVMVYGTGGYARTSTATEFYVRATPSVNDLRTSSSDGWFAGGGVEWAMTKNWILGFEYRHIEANRVLAGPAVPLSNVSRYVDTSSDEFKARLSFKLGQ